MSGGILLVLAGIWVGCQVLGGNALGRLGIDGSSSASTTTPTSVPTSNPNVLGTPGQPATLGGGPGTNAVAGALSDALQRQGETTS